MAKDAPTPKRKDSEALNKVNAITSPATKATKTRDRTEMKAKRRASRAAYMRGEESALPIRDRGAVRRFVRDYVDSHRSVGEFFLPAMVVVLFLMAFGGNKSKHVTVVQSVGFLVMYLGIGAILISSILISRNIRKAVNAKFPGDSTKGLGLYGFLRSTQMRRMRAPSPQVKRGDAV